MKGARLSLTGIVTVCSLMVVASTLGGFLGSFHWALNVLSHFRVQYLVCLTIAVAALMALRAWRRSLVCALFAVVNLLMILPLFFGKAETPASAMEFRVMLVNVNRWNNRTNLVRKCIEEADADVIVLEEVDSGWMNRLEDVCAKYPYTETRPRDDCFGIAMLSKYPLENAEIIYLGTAEVPSVSAEVDVNGRSLFVLGTHPLPPGTTAYWRHRNSQLSAIPGYLADVELPIILLGDLNATPWCPYFRALLRDSGLKDSEQGHGVQPTWPSHNPLLLVPLDHCLVSPEIVVTSRKVGPYTGSDHYPLVVDLAL